jgi:hypothetical protein
VVFRPQNYDIEDKYSDDELSDDEIDEDDVSEAMVDKPSAYQILEAWKEKREMDRSLLDAEIDSG